MKPTATTTMATLSNQQQWFFYMHHPIDRIAHINAFVIPVMKHWLERETGAIRSQKHIYQSVMCHLKTQLKLIFIYLFIYLTLVSTLFFKCLYWCEKFIFMSKIPSISLMRVELRPTIYQVSTYTIGLWLRTHIVHHNAHIHTISVHFDLTYEF